MLLLLLLLPSPIPSRLRAVALRPSLPTARARPAAAARPWRRARLRAVDRRPHRTRARPTPPRARPTPGSNGQSRGGGVGGGRLGEARGWCRAPAARRPRRSRRRACPRVSRGERVRPRPAARPLRRPRPGGGPRRREAGGEGEEASARCCRFRRWRPRECCCCRGAWSWRPRCYGQGRSRAWCL